MQYQKETGVTHKRGKFHDFISESALCVCKFHQLLSDKSDQSCNSCVLLQAGTDKKACRLQIVQNAFQMAWMAKLCRLEIQKKLVGISNTVRSHLGIVCAD